MKHDIILKGYGAFMPTTPSKMLCLGTAESYGIEQLNIIPGAGWEGLVIKATFHPASSEPVVVVVGENGGVIDVPPEATAKATAESSPGVIVFSGVADGVQRISADIAYTVLGHAPVDGKDSEPTPNQWEQLAAQYQSKIDKQQGAENAGKVLGIGEDGMVKPVEQGGGGGAGNNGATFIPSVDEDGFISWTNDGGLPNPEPVNIKGAPGKPGDNYVLTEADKQEIADMVEVPGGGSDYTLPVATETKLGGVKAIAKTDDMTQRVGVDENGMLWVVPTGSSSGGDAGGDTGGGEDSGGEGDGGDGDDIVIVDTPIDVTFVAGSFTGTNGAFNPGATMSRCSHVDLVDGLTQNIKFVWTVPSDETVTDAKMLYRVFLFDANDTFVSNWNLDGTTDTVDQWQNATLDGTEHIIPAGYKVRFVFGKAGSFSNGAMLTWANDDFKVYYTKEVSGGAEETAAVTESVSMRSFNRVYTDTGEYTEKLLPKWDGMFVIHRGYSTAPANTLQAIWEAKKHGYNCCEVDVRLTSDGQVVLNHDATVTGTVDGVTTTYTIAETPLETLQTMCVGNTSFPTAKVCSLEDAMRLCRRAGMRLDIDFKVASDQIYSDCLALAMKYGMQDDVIFTCSVSRAVQIKTAYRKASVRVDGASLDNDTALDEFIDDFGNVYAYYSAGECGKTNGSNVANNVNNETRILANKARGYKMYVWNVTPNILPDVMQWEPDVLQPQSSRDGTDWYSAIRDLNNFDSLIF